MMEIWQRTYRRSTDGVSPTLVPKIVETKAKSKSRKLSVVDEVDDHNSQHPITHFAQRSRLESEAEGRKLDTDVTVKAPTKATKKTSFLKPIPQYEKYEDKFNPPLSPVPLPEGVVNIDDVTDSCTVYGADIIKYISARENEFRVVKIRGDQRNIVHARNKIVGWMQALLHYLKASFETTFHAINILDRTLERKVVRNEDLQLIAITAVLIATKMEEYYTADIVELLKCTEDSYTQRDVLAAEKQILRIIDFKLFGNEPTLFVNRFIAAAFRQGDKIFKELVMFMMDTLTVDMSRWSNLTSLKAAAAVYASLFMPVSLNAGFRRFDDDTVWTPTLVYYTSYLESELLELATYMLEMLKVCLEMRTDPHANESSRYYRLKSKYTSSSRHYNLFGQAGMSVDNAAFALACVQSRKAKLIDSNVSDLNDSANARLPDSADARLPDSANARLPDSANARLPDSADARLPDSADARLPDSADARLPDSANAKLPDSANAKLPDFANAKLPDSAEIQSTIHNKV